MTWTSDDDGVATVDEGGVVTAVATGSTIITATSIHDPTNSANVAVTVSSSGPGPQASTVQFGTSGIDMGAAVAVDAQGSIIVVGSTMGSLAGPNAGGYDAFVRKYAPDGDMQWTRQFGRAAWDEALAVTTDEHGNILVAGATGGNFDGPSQGNSDVFVRQYAPDGDVGWTHQFGTAQFDRGLAIANDGGGDLIVAGQGVGALTGEGVTANAGFVRKFRKTPGEGLAVEWTFATPTHFEGLAADSAGNVIAIGTSQVPELGNEVYVVKLTPAGDVQWTGRYGTGSVPAVVGGARDAGPATRRPTQLWQNLVGFEDFGHAVAVDAAGNLIVTGYMGGYETGTGHSNQKAYVLKPTPSGEEAWAVLFGDTSATFGNDVAIDAGGNVIVAGNTASYYSDRSPPGIEVFTRKLSPDGTMTPAVTPAGIRASAWRSTGKATSSPSGTRSGSSGVPTAAFATSSCASAYPDGPDARGAWSRGCVGEPRGRTTH